MKRTFVLVFSFSAVMLLYCCQDKIDSNYLTTNNKSQHIIFSIISPSDDMSAGSYYEEFQDGYDPEKDVLGPFQFEEIESNSKYANHDSPRLWSYFFENIKDKKMRLFIVLKDSVDKYGWKTIFKNQIYNKKYKLSLEDLKQQDWEVVYE